ncbi:hypothetical protein Bphy_1241 [Paraburkholderia phymatum STM815]|uniref:Uncharacterized protein n=1 Tax=Paraburkholderia phymatum (strain DSM 17167 / CIP 108236 / LMG 21445 / STM815) TaxID=391038 RepID=B2JHT2_PARP8|nr:hypothetical protein Bphy_1241 [Paraburkholderia phymatum STM815]
MLVQPRKPSFASWLMSMPDVGEDAVTERGRALTKLIAATAWIDNLTVVTRNVQTSMARRREF